LGDYIYEQGGGSNDRAHDPASEIWQLNDYRTRYSQYKLDNYLGKSHQLYPFIQIWDDHDIVVDAVSDTSLAHQGQYGSYQTRKWAAVKAFREWNPVRDDTSSFIKNWRKFSFGNTLEMFVIDVRLYDRDKFPQNINDTMYNSPFAKMLGPEQLNWLLTNLQQSTAKWKIIANGLMFSQLEALGTPLVLENWDGYNHERNQIFQLIKNQNISNVIVYSGDFHCAFANDLSDNPFNFLNYNPLNGNGSLAVEFIPPSASSDNFDEGNDFGLGAGNYQLAQSLITTGNPHVKYVNLIDHGYGLLDLNGNRAQNEFWYVNSVFDPAVTTTNCGNVSVVQNNANKISAGGNPVPNGNLGFKPTGCFDDVLGLSTVESSNQMAVISCFPNPFSSFISFQIMGNVGARVKVELIDALGRIVEKRDFIQSEVIENFVFESKLDLASGFYTFRVFNEQFSWNKLLVKR
jgi:alkaline phosphatase D